MMLFVASHAGTRVRALFPKARTVRILVGAKIRFGIENLMTSGATEPDHPPSMQLGLRVIFNFDVVTKPILSTFSKLIVDGNIELTKGYWEKAVVAKGFVDEEIAILGIVLPVTPFLAMLIPCTWGILI
jgi:hypothetical protein